MWYSDSEIEPLDRDRVINALREEILKILFVKADGSSRVLYGTLIPEYLPPVNEEHVPKQRKVATETVAAFDLVKKEWRSFRLDSVLSIMPYVHDKDGVLV